MRTPTSIKAQRIYRGSPDPSSTDTLGSKCELGIIRESLITERKLGALSKSSSHLLGGPSVRPACRNMHVPVVFAAKISFKSLGILMEGVGLRIRDKQIHYIPIMEIRAEKLNATQRDKTLAQ